MAISFGRARLDSFSRGKIRQMYVAEGTGGSRGKANPAMAAPKTSEGGPTCQHHVTCNM